MASVQQNLRIVIDADNNTRSAFDNIDKDANRALGNNQGKGLAGLGMGAKLAMGAAAAGVAALGAGLVASVTKAQDFEASMSKVKAITGASGEEFTKLEELARTMGSTTAFSAQEAAEGIVFLGQAGFDANEIMTALPETLALASAGGLDLGSAADIASNALSGMRMDVSELSTVTDGFAVVAANSNTNVQQLGDAFAYAAPGAAAAGLKFEDVAAAVGVLGDNGIQASSAGTALNAALRQMIKPSNDAAAAARDLGLKFLDAEGNVRPLDEIVRELEVAQITAKDAMVLFGEEGGRAINALVGSGSPRLLELKGIIESSDGAARDMADTMTDNLEGSMKELSSATDELAIAVGEVLVPALRVVIEDWVTPAVRKFGEWVEVLKENEEKLAMLAEGLRLMGGPFALAGASYLALRNKIRDTNDELDDQKKKANDVRLRMFQLATPINLVSEAEAEAAVEAEKFLQKMRNMESAMLNDFTPAIVEANQKLGFMAEKFDEVDISADTAAATTTTFGERVEVAISDSLGGALEGAFVNMMEGGGLGSSLRQAVGTVAIAIGNAIGGPVGGAIASFVSQGLMANSLSPKQRMSKGAAAVLTAFELSGGDVRQMGALQGELEGALDIWGRVGDKDKYNKLFKEIEEKYGLSQDQTQEIMTVISRQRRGLSISDEQANRVNEMLNTVLVLLEVQGAVQTGRAGAYRGRINETAAALMAAMGITPAAEGFSGVVSRPQLFLAGEAGAEQVDITPLGRGGGSAGPNVYVTNHIQAWDRRDIEAFVESEMGPRLIRFLRSESARGVGVLESGGLINERVV